MWKRGGRSSALDRAQALLSAKRSSRADASAPGSAAQTAAVGGSLKNRSSLPNTHLLISDLSDLSSVSSAPEHGADTVGPAVWTAQEREGSSTKDVRPQSSLGGGGSRFLKKAPPPAATSSQSTVNKQQLHQATEYRNVSSSQTAALNRLAQIESRIRSRQQVQQPLIRKPRPAENLSSDVEIQPPPPAAKFLDEHLSAQSSSDQGLKGKRFLKNKTGMTGDTTNTAAAAAAAASARCPKDADVGVRSRAADVVVPSIDLEAMSVREMRGVSLESDEEDMKKLLGDSLDSSDNSFLLRGRPSSIRRDEMNRSSQQVLSSSPPSPVPPPSSSNAAPPRSPASPSHRRSPFRFAGHAQAHFSPSALSPSPSPPERLGSPQRSLSSLSGREEVLSLEELFSAGPGSEDLHSEMSASEDFKINLMTLDDLVPVAIGLTAQTPGKQREVKHAAPPQSPNKHRSRLKEEKEEQEEEEEALDYQSDFESESRTEPDYSFSQVSEHLQEEVVSEVREEASRLDLSHGRTEDDYSSTVSEASRSSCTSVRSHIPSRSRSSASHGSRTSSPQLRRPASTKKVLREAAVQTQPNPLAYTRPAGAFGAAVDMAYMDQTPVAAHILSAETVEALSTFNPAGLALHELLKQQLAVTRRFIESSRQLHSSLVQSLGPPNYRYTTLEIKCGFLKLSHRTFTSKELPH